MGDNRIKLVSILCTIVMIATVFSAIVKNVTAEKNTEEEIEHLNPDVAVSNEGMVHIVWQENLTGNYEIYYANNLTGAYKTELDTAVEKVQSLIANTTDKKLKSELEKVLKELNKALANATANDYQHSFKHLQHAVERLDKKDLNCGEITTALVNSARDITKVNILYREFLNISQDHTTKAWEKFYKGLEKLNEEKYDKAVNEFRKAFKEAYKIDDDCEDEECSKKTNAGIDFGEIVRISYTNYNSVFPKIYLNGFISVSWIERLEKGSHIMYARSINNGTTWWYFDVNTYAEKYLNFRGISLPMLPGLIDFPNLDDWLERIQYLINILGDKFSTIRGEIATNIRVIPGCHYIYGRIGSAADGRSVFAPIGDPWLTGYDYSIIPIDGESYYCAPHPAPGSVPLPTGPDLAVEINSLSPKYGGYIFEGDTDITLSAKNLGDAFVSGEITVRVYIDSTLVYSTTLSSLNVKEIITLIITLLLIAGLHTLWVIISAAITDANPINNNFTYNTIVLAKNRDNDGDNLTNWQEAGIGITRYVVDKGPKGYLFFKDAPPAYNQTFTYKTNPLENDTDKDGQNDSTDPVPLDYDMDGDGYISYSYLVNPTSCWYTERLVAPVNNDPNIKKDSAGNLISDRDVDGDGLGFDESWTYNDDTDVDADGMSDLYESDYGIRTGGWQNRYIYNARYAVIVVGGGKDLPGSAKPMEGDHGAFWNDGMELYNKLASDYRYMDANIYLLHSHGWRDGERSWSTDSRWDGEATIDNIDNAFNELKYKITINDFFFFAEICHASGSRDFKTTSPTEGMFFYRPDIYTPLEKTLDYQLNKLSPARMCIVLQSCYSGGGIDDLSKEDRIVISASKSDELTYTWKTSYLGGPSQQEAAEHWEFLYNDKGDGFLRAIGNINSPVSILQGYYSGYDAAKDKDFGEAISHALLEDCMVDGNTGHEKSGLSETDPNKDGYLAKRTFL